MKRIGLAIGVGCVAALGGVGIAEAAKSGSGDQVTGAIKREGLHDNLDRHFIISAHDGPNGATGSYEATYGKGPSRTGYSGRVTCVKAEGNLAMVGIQVTSSTQFDAVVGSYEILRIVDNGTPNDGGEVDALSPGVFTAGPVTCAPRYDTSPTYSGNLTVKDGDL
jgi:hypothetical protein